MDGKELATQLVIAAIEQSEALAKEPRLGSLFELFCPSLLAAAGPHQTTDVDMDELAKLLHISRLEAVVKMVVRVYARQHNTDAARYRGDGLKGK